MLAIIIPYYNLLFFDQTLQSLANQTDKRFKVYIGNDASFEDCSVLLEKYKLKINFEYQRFENNLGGIQLEKHWERCIEMCKNEKWVAILGDDDCVDSNYIEQFYKNIDIVEQHKIQVIRYATQIINEKSQPVNKIIYKHEEVENSCDFLIKKFTQKSRSSLSELIFLKETLNQIKFKNFPLAWHTDDLAFLEVSNFQSLFSINDSVVSIRVSNTSITGIQTNRLLKSKATFEFCTLLLTKYKTKFSTSQKEIITSKFEKAFIDSPSKIVFLKVLYFKIKYANFLSIFKFIYRGMRGLIQKK